MEWEPASGEPARVICRKAQLFSKSLLELLHRKNLLGTECLLLAQSRHAENAIDVAIGGKADMLFCTAYVR
jgi:hypothetical protein